MAAPPADRSGVIAILVAAMLWSTGGLLIKWVDVDAFAITMWRSAFAALTIAAIMRPPLEVPRSWTFWGVAVSYAAMLFLFVVATRLTAAANAIFLQYTAPLYVLFLGGRFLAERPRVPDFVAIGVAMGGMALFFVGDFDPSGTTGNLAAIGSGVAFAAFLVFLRRPAATASLRPQGMIAGSLLLVAVTLPINLARPDSGAFTPGVSEFAALAFLGVAQIGLAYVFFAHGIARTPALQAAMIGMLEPVLNPLWVLLFLGERPGLWAVIGGAVIIAAVAGRQVVGLRERMDPASAGGPP